MKHLSVVMWALRELWGLKGIWITDRLKLWRKSVNLYSAFLAFTDKERPADQIRKAMACAMLSSVYDFESDWDYGNRKGRLFGELLEKYVVSQKTRSVAAQLFSADTRNKLSKEGLERGGVALIFYNEVIRAEWMLAYAPEEIYEFGCKLQILDDLLDLRSDRLRQHTNCFLSDAHKYALEAVEFIESKLFRKLAENSKIYRTLKRRAQKLLAGFEKEEEVALSKLFQTGRPMSAGIYALALSVVGFRILGPTPWFLQMLTAFTYAGLTMSIMSFNAWKDREHDRRKFEFFASSHPKKLFKYWLKLNAVTCGLVGVLSYLNPGLSLFCTSVWLLGLLYSFIPHWFILQNIVVAFCAASPALCGAILHKQLPHEAAATFLLFFVLIWIDEIYLDTEDMESDQGYKETLPIRWGHVRTFACLIGLFALVPFTFTMHTNPWIRLMAWVATPVLAFKQGLAFLHRERILGVLSTIRWILKILIIVLLTT